MTRFQACLGVMLAIAVTGCSASHADGDAGPADLDAPMRPRPDSGPRDPAAEPPPGAAVCGGVVCETGEECCILLARCVPIGDPSCAIPAGTDVPSPCTRAADCAEGEVCGIPDGVDYVPRCGGWVGSCIDRGSECGGFGDGVCGCDGRTYVDPCAANAAGTEMGAPVPCGTVVAPLTRYMCDAEHLGCPPHMHCDPDAMWCVIEEPLYACGIDAQCPVGELCCGWTGHCYDASRPAACAVPPEGSTGPCADDTDCTRGDGSYWANGPARSFCGGPGCGPGGGCMPIPDRCDGVLAPVCGCDGRSYQNACEAARAQVRVTHDGEC